LDFDFGGETMADEGEIGPNDVISDFKITTYSQPGHEQTFCSFEFNIKAGTKKIELTFTAPGASGVLFVPCQNFDKYYAGNDKTIGENVILANQEESECRVTVPTNFITKPDKDAKLIFEYIPEDGVSINMSSILLGWRNFGEIYYTYDDDECRHSINEKPKTVNDNPVTARLDWISKFIGQYYDRSKDKKIPQFHIKQQATINALNYIYSKKNISKSSLVTYVGTDDTANVLTSMERVSRNHKKETLRLLIRNSPAYDISTETAFLKNQLKSLGINDMNTNKHDDPWTDSKNSQLIIDTYTVMSWQCTGDVQTLTEIGNRINALDEKGSLVLVFPQKCELERFSLTDELPNLFKLQIAELSKKVKEHLSNQDLSITGETIGNTKVITIGKYLDKKNLENNTSDTGWSDDVGEPPKREEKKVKLDNRYNEEITQVLNWDEYRDAIKRRGQKNRMKRPIQLPIIRKIRYHLENEALNGAENFIMVQWHPGWGKTSIVGEVLFPKDSDNSYFLENYSIWVGTLNEVESWLKSRPPSNNDIVIIDDLHNYRKGNDNIELIGRCEEISGKVAALITTCQIEPMAGFIRFDFEELEDNEILKIWDFGNFPENDDDEKNNEHLFAQNLANKAISESERNNQLSGLYHHWVTAIYTQLFSKENKASKGKLYSPRDAIRDLKKAKRHYERNSMNPKRNEPSFYNEIFKFGEFEDGEN
jgi:hypothetical protein